jgi:hypothetical protein
MNKVEHKKISHEVVTILSGDIPVGTYFYWDERSGELFLKTYECIASVDDPSSTWNSDNMELVGYRPVEVTVKVERYL